MAAKNASAYQSPNLGWGRLFNRCMGGDLILQERLFPYILQPYKCVDTNPTAVFSMSGILLLHTL